MTSESPSRSPISLLTIASELLLAIVASLPVEMAYWRQSTAGASRPCRAAMQLQKDDLTLRSGPQGRVSKGGTSRAVAMLRDGRSAASSACGLYASGAT